MAKIGGKKDFYNLSELSSIDRKQNLKHSETYSRILTFLEKNGRTLISIPNTHDYTKFKPSYSSPLDHPLESRVP